MFKAHFHTQFKKDYKKIIKRNKDITKLEEVMEQLITEQELTERFKDHQLAGNYVGYRECHIESDWLLIYKIDKDENIIFFVRTGTHSDLFE